MNISPIGFFESDQKLPYQAGKQPDELGLNGQIKLIEGQNFQQALTYLETCSHIWVIFGFHLNDNWKPLILPPHSEKKVGVFATRSPHRPNPIGLSLVPLVAIQDLIIKIGPNDILDASPIFDIKPYHPEYDFVENAQIGWLQTIKCSKFQVHFSPLAEAQLEFLEKYNIRELKTFIQRQLEFDPQNTQKKRLLLSEPISTLCYRTWRIDFSLIEDKVGVLSIHSGYTNEELLSFEDPYADKKAHRAFHKEFGLK